MKRFMRTASYRDWMLFMHPEQEGVAEEDYEAIAKEILAAIPDRSISFEVFADDFSEMERQARRITTWGRHVISSIDSTSAEIARRDPPNHLKRADRKVTG